MPQIQQRCLHAFLFQLFVCLFKLFTGIFIKHGDADITDFGIRQHLPGYGLDFNVVPHDIRRELLPVFMLQQEFDAGSLFAPYGADYVFQGTAFRIFIVNL